MKRATAAFTLIELIVVIGIIAVIIGILLPALASARNSAKMIRETSAAGQLITAYASYALEHDGRLLPGYANEPARDGRGDVVTSPANYRYPWRLASYLNYQIRGAILVNDQTKLWRDYDGDAPHDWYYDISVFPSFGLNYDFLGGDLVHGGLPLYITKLAQAVHPSHMIVFGSARYNAYGEPEHGYHQIQAPVFPLNTGWASRFNEQDSAYRWGFVDPRWNGRATFSFLDGHAGLLSTRQMRDMTRWSNQAAMLGDPNWSPALP